MSFVIIRGERFALEFGQTVLGGTGDGALLTGDLAALSPSAVIDYPVEGASTVRALPGARVLLNGTALGADPHPMRHGDRLELGTLHIAFGDIRTAGRTNRAPGISDAILLGDLLGEPLPTAPTGGRLTRRADGSVRAIPTDGLTIGRDPDCGLVLESKQISRRHATIAPALLGYVIADHSSNGVQVNGARIEGSRLLGQRDVVRIGDEEFVFEADSATFEPTARYEDPAPAPDARPAAPPAAAAPILASLEVITDGPLKGQRHRVERPTVQIGRGMQNDIQFANDGVSGVHASLVLRGGTWHVLDLGSKNGTYVDGEVVREPRVLPRVCELRLGPLALVFRAIGSTQQVSAHGTIGVIGLTEDQLAGR